MSAGIRATVSFSTPEVCSIAELTATVNTTIDSISTSVALPDSEGSVTEFLVDTDDIPDDTEFELIFSYGAKHLYRATHEGQARCPCEILGQFGCPIDRYFAQDGDLTVAFHAADFETLQDVINELRDRYPEMDLRRLVRSPTGDAAHDSVFVNRGKLTDRQLEVLRTAYEKGYFERPRRANANEIAAELGINPSTFSEHLAATQTKLFEDILEDGT